MHIHCEDYNTLQFAVLLNYELLSFIQKSISILSITFPNFERKKSK